MSQVVGNELQVGDLVRVIDADSALHGLEGYIAKTDFGAPPNVYLFESDDKQNRGWFAVESLRKSLRKLRDSWGSEPPTDHIADADEMVGAPQRDGLVLRSEWNAEQGCFEDSFVEPEKESSWEPKPNEWVRLPNGAVRQVTVNGYEIHGTKKYYRFELFNSRFELGTLKPWEPRTGEKVQLINESVVYEVQNFDKTTKMVFFVDRYLGLELRLLKPYIEEPEPQFDHIADVNKMDSSAIPAGWRELRNGEKRLKTDLFDFEGKWTPFRDYDPSASEFPEYHKTIHRRHIRKVEPEKVVCDHRVCELAKPTTVTCPPDSCDLDDGVRELPTKEPEYQYRTPHPGDVGKRIEVSDSEDPTSDDSVWRERTLVAVLSFPDERPRGEFVTAVEGYDAKHICHTWKHARIKVEQPAINEPTSESQGHPDHVEGVWVEEGINATSINFKPKRLVVYIAGPMRGIPHFNFPAFDAAKAYLIERGYDVLSPADFDRELDGFDPCKPEYETAEGCAEFPGEMDFRRVVTRDLKAVKQCDAIALLPGWENSKGAVAEIAVAHWMGKPVKHLLCDSHRPNEVVCIVNNDSTTLEQFVLQLAHAHDAHNKAINCAIDPPPLEQDPACDILDVAASITRGDRQAVYGPPDQDFRKTADMWTGMFQYMLAPGAKFEPRHVAMAMICLKLSREFHQRKRDNWIDIAGYARCGSLCS